MYLLTEAHLQHLGQPLSCSWLARDRADGEYARTHASARIGAAGTQINTAWRRASIGRAHCFTASATKHASSGRGSNFHYHGLLNALHRNLAVLSQLWFY